MPRRRFPDCTHRPTRSACCHRPDTLPLYIRSGRLADRSSALKLLPQFSHLDRSELDSDRRIEGSPFRMLNELQAEQVFYEHKL